MKSRNESNFWGISIFGTLLVLGALGWFMLSLSNFSFYEHLFRHLSREAVVSRYSLSVSARLIGLIAGIGILYRKNIFRRIGIYLCLSTLVSIYWKHPVVLFEQAVYDLDAKTNNMFSVLQEHGISYLDIAHISRFILCLLDVCFALCFIFYFTRPKVKEQFKN